MENQQEIDDFSCTLCNQQFNDNDRMPRIFTCGHTFCCSCITSLIDTANSQQIQLACPLDKEEIPQQKLESFPKNIQLLKVISRMKQQLQQSVQLNSKGVNNSTDVNEKQELNIAVQENQILSKSLQSSSQKESPTLTIVEQQINNQVQQQLQQQQYTDTQQKLDFQQCNEEMQLQDLQEDENNNNQQQQLQQEKLNLIKEPSQEEQLLFDDDLQQQDGLNGPQSMKMCMIHDRKLEVVCIACKVPICTNCALFGSHKNHEIRSEEEVICSITMRAEQAVDIMQKIEQEKSELSGDRINTYISYKFDTKKNEIRSIIQQKFGELVHQIKQKEKKALDDLEKGIFKKMESVKSQTRFPNELDSNFKFWRQETQQNITDLTDKSEKGQLSFSFLEDPKNMENDILQRGIIIMQQLEIYKTSLQAGIEEQCIKAITVEFNDQLKSGLDNYCQLNFEQKVAYNNNIASLQVPGQQQSSHFFKTGHNANVNSVPQQQQQLLSSNCKPQQQQLQMQPNQQQQQQLLLLQQQQQQQLQQFQQQQNQSVNPQQQLNMMMINSAILDQNSCSISSQNLFQQTQQQQMQLAMQQQQQQQYDSQLLSPIVEKEDGNLMANISESDLQDTSFLELNNNNSNQNKLLQQTGLLNFNNTLSNHSNSLLQNGNFSKLNIDQVVAAVPSENSSCNSNSKELSSTNSMVNTPRLSKQLRHNRTASQQIILDQNSSNSANNSSNGGLSNGSQNNNSNSSNNNSNGNNGLNGVLKSSDITNHSNVVPILQLQQHQHNIPPQLLLPQQQQQQQQLQQQQPLQLQQQTSCINLGNTAQLASQFLNNTKRRKTILIKLPEKFDQQVEDLRRGTAECTDLTGAEMSDSELIKVCELVKQNPGLKTLKLRKNKISDEGLCILLQAVFQSQSIQTLDLAQNQLTDKAVDMLLEHGKGHQTLKNVNLSFNKINQRNIKNKIQELKKLGITLSAQLK